MIAKRHTALQFRTLSNLSDYDAFIGKPTLKKRQNKFEEQKAVLKNTLK